MPSGGSTPGPEVHTLCVLCTAQCIRAPWLVPGGGGGQGLARHGYNLTGAPGASLSAAPRDDEPPRGGWHTIPTFESFVRYLTLEGYTAVPALHVHFMTVEERCGP